MGFPCYSKVKRLIPKTMGRHDSNHSHVTRLPVDVVTPIPHQNQWLAWEDEPDECLDSYDQQCFSQYINNEQIGLEERMTYLSVNLPPMPLQNSSYPSIPSLDCLLLDIVDSIGHSSDNDDSPRTQQTLVQQAKLYVE